MTTHLERRYADRIEEFADRHPFVVDLVLVAALMGSATLGSLLTLPGADPPDQDRTSAVLMGVSCLALLKHRTHPRTALVVTALCTVAVVAMGYLVTPLLLAPIMAALYWLATHTDRRTTRAYGIPTTVALILAAVFSDSMDHLSLLLRTIGPFFWLMLPLAAGKMTQLRRAYLSSMRARAEHAERTREEEARLRVTEERMRIARELHDVVAHHLALANAQAGTAAHLALTRPEQTQKILTDLTGTTSSALRELKATLGLLRQNGEPDSPPLEPSPGLARLPELVSACASAGVTVTVTTQGEPQPLSPGVDLTAFRIVQEALTNVTKHAAAEAAHVRLDYSASRLMITVSNDGPASPAASEGARSRGFGVMGMRERARSIGGELCAGHRPEGGFEVSTALPLHPHAPDHEGNGPGA
ncbi:MULTISPECIES: sensor histidine kinase [unclassified Streptomyces]|uniref:sensor histidine kinase n=1 Tax=unclassified Streptomyces TaxID=2593676 RepID=UPI002366A57D|nr:MULTISPECIES: sensor histidine kinase [unclassified Streptomyces]MDF3144017.1 sensor histidine kinase [Streptomyces sp. T21Q-yed]WDF39794.1 sensor histidine kinase [Streptomyces sp. T12]